LNTKGIPGRRAAERIKVTYTIDTTVIAATLVRLVRTKCLCITTTVSAAILGATAGTLAIIRLTRAISTTTGNGRIAAVARIRITGIRRARISVIAVHRRVDTGQFGLTKNTSTESRKTQRRIAGIIADTTTIRLTVSTVFSVARRADPIAAASTTILLATSAVLTGVS